MTVITVETKGKGYMAYLDGDKSLWEQGGSPEEAIGRLIITRKRRMGIELEMPP